MNKTEELIRKYLKSVNMMQLAVISEREPWVCSIYYALDDELDMYWISLPDTTHSKALTENDSASVAVPVKHEYGKPIAGLTIQGNAEPVSNLEDNRQALEMYKEQMNREDSFVNDMISGKNPHKLYVFKPKKFKLFDRINFEPGKEQHEWVINE